MAEIIKFKPSTKERNKPEKPADVIDFEAAKKRRESLESLKKSPDTTSVLDYAFKLVREGLLDKKEIDETNNMSANEKKLLKDLSDRIKELGGKNEEIKKLKRQLRELGQEPEEKTI